MTTARLKEELGALLLCVYMIRAPHFIYIEGRARILKFSRKRSEFVVLYIPQSDID